MKGSIIDEGRMKQALDGVEAIVHLAAIVGYPACKKEPQVAQATNVEGTRTPRRAPQARPEVPLRLHRQHLRVDPRLRLQRRHPARPISLYGETKAAAEEMVLDAGNSVAYRYATAFGVSNRMRLDLMPNDFTYQAVKNRNLIVYEGAFKRTFVHVRDMARSILFALDRYRDMRDDVYNVGHER